MQNPITQSKAWKKLQEDLGELSFEEKGKDYYFLAILNKTPVAKYLYLPYGPVFQDIKGYKNAIASLKKLAIAHNASFIRIEPQDPKIISVFSKDYKKSQDLNPKETWVLNLSGTEQELKNRLPSRLLRYYKNKEKNGITIETTNNPDDITYLTKLQNALAKKKGINTFSEKYLKTELSQPFATLYFLKHQDETGNKEVLAAGLVFDDKTTRYNLQGAQSEQGRKLHATGILTIQLINDAKEKNLKTFDFWGIAPENAPKDHPWAGFTNFKKTFDGREVDYAGTYDLILKPFKYKLYTLFRKINRIIK